MQKFFDLIKLERQRQDEKWGPGVHYRNDNHLALAVLAEEFGEVAHAILEHDPENLKEEIVQVAAVCVKWLEMIEGNNEV